MKEKKIVILVHHPGSVEYNALLYAFLFYVKAKKKVEKIKLEKTFDLQKLQ